MTSAHTKGPWRTAYRLDRTTGVPLKGGRFVILQEGSSLREDFFICEMPFAAVRGADEREQEANARLIAAAPEMLEALQLHVAYEATPQDRGGSSGPKGRAHAAFLAARDAAIAKAERRG